MKKVFAVLLSLAMVLGMSVTAFAAGDAQKDPHITVSNLPIGTTEHPTTVKYMQIAKAAPTDPIGWTLADNVTLSNGVTLEDLVKVSGGNANAEAGKIGHDTVVKAIQGISIPDNDAHSFTASGETALIYDVEPGLYIIQVNAEGYTFSRMLAYVEYNEARTAAVLNTPVTVKGESDKVSKSVGADDISVAVGDVVPFTVTIQYPYLDGTWNQATNKMEYPVFTITDTVTGGTVVTKTEGTKTLEDIIVKIDGKVVGGNDTDPAKNLPADLAAIGENTFSAPATDSFKIIFAYDPQYASKDIEITYNVKVTEALSDNTKLQNHVKAEIGDKTTEAEVINPTVKAIVTKREAHIVDGTEQNDGELLQDARFKLYVVVDDEAEATHAVGKKTVDGKEINVIITKPGTIEAGTALLKEVVYTKEADGTTNIENDANGNYPGRKTDTTGTVTFDKLDAQKTYWVVESKAPDGYSLNEEAKQLTGATYTAGTPTQNPDTKVWVTENTATDFTGVTITDTNLVALPSTGGIGTTIFTIGGCAIMIVAAGLFFATRRKTGR